MKYLFTLIAMASTLSLSAQEVMMVSDSAESRVDVFIGGKLFTSYLYAKNMEKPVLYPVNAPNGSVVTRGYPLVPRAGERVDHPHHTGLWFNHGDINGLDFWNNSSAIPDGDKKKYGHITVKRIMKSVFGNTAMLMVRCAWNDSENNTLLVENVVYSFTPAFGGWMIDHTSTLTAVSGQVTFTDSKEGMFAVRVDRAFEMPSEEKLIFTDSKGNPTTVARTDNTGVTGMYRSGSGKTGDAVWGTRNNWVILSGVKDKVPVSMAIFDHPSNPGFPAYAHARGYGLFSVNNFGQKSYDTSKEKFVFRLDSGNQVVLKHRYFVIAGSELTDQKAEEIFSDFSKTR